MLTIFFLVLPDRVVIISSTPKKISLHVTVINRPVLRQLVFALRNQLYPEGRSRSIGSARPVVAPAVIGLPQILPHLDNVLQLSAILKEHDDAITDIRFLADDILHGLPFTLLHIAGELLPEKYRISVATDEKNIERQTPSGNKDILIAGVADYRGIYNSLPGVTREVEQVKAALDAPGAGITVLLNEETSVDAVKSRLAGARRAHFSCHGTFNFQQPDQSGLLLSGGELFSLKDISSMPGLQNVDLIVLSSCRGAEHYILPGRWIIGLPETFCRAGVKAVLAFLWPVHDDFAAAFSTCFYGHLQQNTPAEAFRQTVLDAKNRKFNLNTIPYWEPQYWAGAIFYEG